MPAMQFGTFAYFITTNSLYYHDGQHWQQCDWDKIVKVKISGGAAALVGQVQLLT